MSKYKLKELINKYYWRAVFFIIAMQMVLMYSPSIVTYLSGSDPMPLNRSAVAVVMPLICFYMIKYVVDKVIDGYYKEENLNNIHKGNETEGKQKNYKSSQAQNQ